MSSADERIAELESELRAAQELLFLTLNEIGEPIVVDIENAREAMKSDRMLDLTLDEKAGTWTIKIVDRT